MRSKWKLPVINLHYQNLIKNVEYEKILFLKKGFSHILHSLLGFVFRIYNGHLFFNILITNNHIGFKFGSFVVTKLLGSNIHINKILKKKKKGHLVNPTSIRLGTFFSWHDFWFIKNSYYSQFLHNLLMLRHLIEYFFAASFLENYGFLYSHLNIAKNKMNNYSICIYTYNGMFENILYNSSMKFINYLKNVIAYLNKYRKYSFRKFHWITKSLGIHSMYIKFLRFKKKYNLYFSNFLFLFFRFFFGKDLLWSKKKKLDIFLDSNLNLFINRFKLESINRYSILNNIKSCLKWNLILLNKPKFNLKFILNIFNIFKINFKLNLGLFNNIKFHLKFILRFNMLNKKKFNFLKKTFKLKNPNIWDIFFKHH